MRKSILIQALVTALLSVTITPSAFALDKCKILKRQHAELNEKKSDLEKMEMIHREQVEAKEIRDRLLNGDEVTEIKLLAEALDDEVKNIYKDQIDQAKYAGVSVGAVIFSTYLIKKINKNLSLKRTFMAQFRMADRRFARVTLNAALVFSIGSTFWLAYSIKENQDKKKMLAELIVKLNSIRDLTEDLLDLREEVDEMEVVFNIQLEKLLFENGVEVVKGQDDEITLNCPEKK